MLIHMAGILAGGGRTEKALTVLDRAIGSVRRYPLISVGLAAAVVLLGGRRLFDVVVRGVTLYTLLRRN